MKRAARIDGNHRPVVEALTKATMRVQSLASMGKGVPDLLVGWRGVNVLLEVKDGTRKPSERTLTADERDWHATWGGQVAVVETPEEAVTAVIAFAKEMGRV